MKDREKIAGVSTREHIPGLSIRALGLFLMLSLPVPGGDGLARVNVQTIIERSVQANKKDFDAAPHYNYQEIDRDGDQSKLYDVTMIYGSPYQMLIAVNGKPLPAAKQAQEQEKRKKVESDRKAESAEDRRKRVAAYEKDRQRDHNMMGQLTAAFNFSLIGEGKLRGFDVYILKAKPRPGYQPPNLDCQVLPGMQGELWIDKKSFQWVKITADVIHPVTIGGFLAQVEPGTRFELDMAPVGGGTWQVSHFATKSHAKVLFMVNHSSSDDETYFHYRSAASGPHALHHHSR